MCSGRRPRSSPNSHPRFLPRLLPSASSVIASIVVAGAPLGVTECGSNSQSIPSGTFEQESCTCWLNPFVGVTVTTAIPGCAAVTVTLDGETDGVEFPVAAVMAIEAAVEVDAAKFVSPPYCAVIECVPVESVEVENVVEPEPLSVPGPRLVAPSKNVTVPVGTFVPLDGRTLAMNVTFVPDAAVAGPVSVVLVEIAVPAFTTCESAVAVLVENLYAGQSHTPTAPQLSVIATCEISRGRSKISPALGALLRVRVRDALCERTNKATRRKQNGWAKPVVVRICGPVGCGSARGASKSAG